MEKICVKCNGNMQKALLNTNAAFCIQATGKKAKPNLCNVDVNVCPECGYIEFYADNPSTFRRIK